MKFFFFVFFLIIQFFSKAQILEDYSINYECGDFKKDLIEERLDKKKYNSRTVKIKDKIFGSKDYCVYFENIDNYEFTNFHIEIDYRINGVVNDKLDWVYENSKQEVHNLLMDLREVILKQDDECHFKRYYFDIKHYYTDTTNKKVAFDIFWLEKKQIEIFFKNEDKKWLFKILELQYEE